jgi:hypothetical protein
MHIKVLLLKMMNTTPLCSIQIQEDKGISNKIRVGHLYLYLSLKTELRQQTKHESIEQFCSGSQEKSAAGNLPAPLFNVEQSFNDMISSEDQASLVLATSTSKVLLTI